MENEGKQKDVLQVLQGVGLALAISLMAMVVFALLLRFTNLSDGIIYPVNQTVKGLAVCAATLIFVRGEKGFVKGLSVGLLFWVASYLLFGVIGGYFSLSFLAIAELVLAMILGAVSGALAVNLKKSG